MDQPKKELSMSANIYPVEYLNETFTADECSQIQFDTDFIQLADNETFAGVHFVADNGEVYATLLVDHEDDQGYITRHSHDWHDEPGEKARCLAELMALRA
jgi:hypothetical protein